jgi:hypothetical protein
MMLSQAATNYTAKLLENKMLRKEWENIQNEYYGSQHVEKGLVETCQDFHDKEIAALTAKHAAQIAALTKPCSPQLIVPNPYSAYHEPDSRKCFDEGFAAGIEAATASEKVEPKNYRELTDTQIQQAWDSAIPNKIWCGVRAAIDADRALQAESAPEPAPVSVTGRWYKPRHCQARFVPPKEYIEHQKAIDYNAGKWLSDEETRTFP